MRNAALTAMLAVAALAGAARADGIPQMIAADPLAREIMAKTSLQNAGVTAAVRAGSGQVVVLHLADVSASFSASLAPAAVSPAALKPAAGLAPKIVKHHGKHHRRMPRRAVEQLRRVSRARIKSW